MEKKKKKKIKLKVELIPQTSFFTNVRSEVSKARWDVLRSKCYYKAKYKCEICGGKGKKWPVECHEVWKYYPKSKKQKLIRLIALCPDCHMVKHIGLAQLHGKLDKAMKHLMKVNKWTKERTERHIEKAWMKWNQRNQVEWKLDITAIRKGK